MLKRSRPFFVLGFALGALSIFLSAQAHATAELDRRFAIETVGILKSWDNVDGLFENYVQESFREVFSREPRFVLHDLSKANEKITNSSLPLHKIIEDSAILAQIARSTRSQSIVRTKVTKNGPNYRFAIDWLHSPQMDVIANETFDTQNLSDVRTALDAALGRLIEKLPFKGHVTGRDNDSVTVNVGSLSSTRVRVGDTLEIATLDAVKKHPLLKEIVEWKLTPTGQVVVEQVEDSIAFGRVQSEEAGRSISRFQKITQVIPYSEPKNPEAGVVLPGNTESSRETHDHPRLGWVAASLGFGNFDREYANSAGTTRVGGGGFVINPKADGQLWLTQNWFIDWALGYGFWSTNQTNLVSGAALSNAGAQSSVTQVKLAGGYSYLVNGDLFGPKGWLTLGLASYSYNLPTSATEFMTSVSFKSLVLGIGGEMPIRDAWGVGLNLDFGILPSATESPILASSGGVASARDLGFQTHLYYWLSPKTRFRFGFDFRSQGADLTSGANLSQKIITVSPALMYYF